MSSRWAALAGGAVLCTLGVAAVSPPSQGAPPVAPDPVAYQKEIAAWRADRAEGLKRADGWLADAGRFRLEEGESRIGSDPAAALRLPAGKAPTFAGTLVRRGEAVAFVPAPGLNPPPTAERHQNGDHGLLMPAAPGGQVTGRLNLADDNTDDGPTVVHLGAVSFYVVRRFDQVIVRIKNAKAAALAVAPDIDNFPVRPDWRIVARYEPYKPPKPVNLTNVAGDSSDQPAEGAVVFERDGKTYRLDAFDESDGRLFIVFGDRTNAFETYGGGRFLDIDGPRDGRVVIDFNKAYNPPCALSTYALCPLPPRQNRLPLPVQAGEKTFRGAHA